MEKVKWGIIGCGDVTEVKSGPAFNKVNNSSLVAVMRRDAIKAKDYAARHGVPKWYDNAHDLIHDPGVNAIYIATPPDSHEAYAIAALRAGKPVYLEKPMTVNATSAKNIMQVVEKTGVKLSVAHYRRQQPVFKKIKALLQEKTIGGIRFIHLQFLQPPLSPDALKDPKMQWRVDHAVAGGGLFHDLAPHQLDLMLYFFGAVKRATGLALNQGGIYAADDMVAGEILFENKIIFSGVWCFTAPPEAAKDQCTITGSAGMISFSVFGEPIIEIVKGEKKEVLRFEKPAHVQQPMIESVVQYFLGNDANPCSVQEGVEVMKLLDAFTTVV